MTDPTPTPSASAEIREAVPSQAAREAAADYTTRVERTTGLNIKAINMRAGRLDGSSLIQAFARFEATIRSEPASAARGGMVLVPRVPTEAMRQAFDAAIAKWLEEDAEETDDSDDAVWSAMIAAAPANPSPPVQDGQEREAALRRLIRQPDQPGGYVGDTFYPVGGTEASHRWNGKAWEWLV